MQVKQISCNNCGATLNVDIGRPKGFCQFCGSPYVIESAMNKPQIDVVATFQQAIKAERSRMYDEAMRLYDLILQVEPTLYAAQIGKAFATLSSLKDNVGNLEYFKTLFEPIVLKAEQTENKENIHTLVLDKVWSIKHLLLEANQINLKTNPPVYMNNLTLIHDLQMYINSYAAREQFPNPNDAYKMNYRQLQKDIIDFGNSIIYMSRKIGTFIPYKWNNPDYLRRVSEDVKQAEKTLKEFNKKFK